MKLIGMLPVRNEDWCIGLTARAALMWCDALIVLFHACADDSPEILYDLKREFPDRLHWVFQEDATWDEMEHRQILLEGARRAGATHVAIVDSDEILTGNLLSSIRENIEKLPRSSILQLPGYNLRGGIERFHSTGIWGHRWFSVAFADDPRLHWSGDQFHHREPMGLSLNQYQPVAQGRGGIMHLWGANERRLKAKHAAYKLTETLRWPSKSHLEINRIYNQAFEPAANRQFDQNWKFDAIPAEWWAPYGHLMQHLHVDAEPWQEAECRRLHAQYGAERFAGLNLFGVCEMATA
jgi:hypothetical protein